MDTLINNIIKSFNDGNWHSLAFITIIAIAYKINSITESLLSLSSRRERFIKELLKENLLTGTTKDTALEVLEGIAFERITGIRGDRFFQNKLKEFIEWSNGEISLTHIPRIRRYMQIEQGKLAIKLNHSSLIEYILNIAFFIVSLLTSISLFLFATTPKLPTINLLIMLTLSAATLAFAMFIAWQGGAYIAAKETKIKLNTFHAEKIVTRTSE